MNISGNSIFMGAYEERKQQTYQLNQDRFVISREKEELIKQSIEAVTKNPDWRKAHVQGAEYSFSKEDIDFLCSEEGFEKMKKDAEDLYIKNADRQKEIAANRNPEDSFWKNTGNQWLIFSEFLYNNNFYADMGDNEVKEKEDLLAQITAGMDHLSRSQYKTGIEFSDFYGHGSNFFMSSGEVLMELEASTEALMYFADRFVPTEARGKFDELIDSYYSHNTQVISEYNNPMESFNKGVYAINSGKYPNSCILKEGTAPNPVGEYKYTLLLGGMTKTMEETKKYQEDISKIFELLRKGSTDTDILKKQRKDLYADYMTKKSDDQTFRSYMAGQASSTFNRIENYWAELCRK